MLVGNAKTLKLNAHRLTFSKTLYHVFAHKSHRRKTFPRIRSLISVKNITSPAPSLATRRIKKSCDLKSSPKMAYNMFDFQEHCLEQMFRGSQSPHTNRNFVPNNVSAIMFRCVH